MRVTDAQIHSIMVQRMNTSSSRLLGLEQQIASGRRVVTPADDPTAATLARRIDAQVTALDSLDTGSLQAETRLEASDSALASIYEQLICVQELAVSMCNETMASADRVAAADRAESMRQSMIDLANTEVAGEHVFGGYASDTNPFLDDGTYVGDPRVPQVELSPGVTITAGPDTETALTAAGGIDVLDVARAVRDALAADDVDALRGCLTDLEQAQEQIRVARARIGGRINRVSEADDVRAALRIRLLDQRSEAVDADLPSTISQMTLTSKALQASMTVAARSLSYTILDKIR